MVLTIAGLDPSSGAGVTADLQTFSAHRLYGTCCITALTVQSTQGVAFVEPVADLIPQTLAHLHADLPAAGIKIGMLATAAAVQAVASFLQASRSARVPVVLDPILRSSSGASLLSAEGLACLQSELLPLVDWITPNSAELAVLSGRQVKLAADLEPALRKLARLHPHLHIVATAGDYQTPTDLLLTPTGEIHGFEGVHIDTSSTHGTGCAFSSAVLSRLVLGDSPVAAVTAAKSYVSEALRRAPGLGKGRGPLNLLWPLEPR